MNAVFVHLILLLFVREASAGISQASAMSLSPSADNIYSMTYSDTASLLPTFCNACELSLELCGCLRSVQTEGGWLPYPQANDTSAPYFASSSALAENNLGDVELQGLTIRPEDILRHPEYPGNELGDHAAQPLTMEDIERLNQVSTEIRPDTIEEWSNLTYNAGDRLSPPQSTVSGKRRHAARLNGFPCDYSDCLEVFHRPCDLRRHQKKHVRKSERPHKCAQCEEAFIYPKDLERHTKTHKQHSLAQKIPCPIEGCRSAKTGFGRRDNYLRHMRDKHSRSSLNTLNTQSSSN